MRTYRFRQLGPAGVPYTYKHITTLERRKEFPQRFRLGENSVAWVADEVDAWVEARVRGRDQNAITSIGNPSCERFTGDDLARLIEGEARRRSVSVEQLIRKIVVETHRDDRDPTRRPAALSTAPT